jgi:uncharacterized protein with NAD-binding domain and iron-sulfur cluster
MTARRVVIIGGGLAGMTVAKELLQQQIPVVLLEAESQLGGKAGAEDVHGMRIEHGYHVFPGWYVNTRQLLRDLDLGGNLIDTAVFFQLKKGDFPHFIAFHTPDSLSNLLKNIFSGLLPWPEALLATFFGLDLASQSFSRRGYLDLVSANGFLRSRFYATERIATMQQQTILQASGIPNYEIAAMTVQKLVQCGLGTPAPMLSILNGNLQDTFIRPFEQLLRKRGAEIQLNRAVQSIELTDQRRVATLRFADGSVLKESGPNDLFVLATPAEVTAQFVDAALFAAEQAVSGAAEEEKSLADLVKLRTAQMAAIDISFKRRIPDLPKEHVTLYGSRYGLSFLDVSQHWAGLPQTRLSLIASDFEPLKALPEEDIATYLIEELRQYVPTIQWSDIDKWIVHTNDDAPLFINTVGAWPFRPATKTRIANLYITGDYCRSEADLATMESAIGSALATARDLLMSEKMGCSPEPLPLKIPPHSRLLLLKYLILPVVGPIGLYYWVQRQIEAARHRG